MKRSSFIAAAGLAATLLAGCGGAPEEMEQQEGQAPEVVTPAPQEGGEVKALYFRWQCGADTASLRDFPGGNTLAQISWGEGVDVRGDDGGSWYYVRRNSTGQFGWTLKHYYCQ